MFRFVNRFSKCFLCFHIFQKYLCFEKKTHPHRFPRGSRHRHVHRGLGRADPGVALVALLIFLFYKMKLIRATKFKRGRQINKNKNIKRINQNLCALVRTDGNKSDCVSLCVPKLLFVAISCGIGLPTELQMFSIIWASM